MEDGEWGEPLLKDCLFSEILGRKTPPLPDDFSAVDSFPFDDLNMIPTSTLFGETTEQKLSPHGSEGSGGRLPSPSSANPTLLNYSRPHTLTVKQEYPDDPTVGEASEWGDGEDSATSFLGQGYEQSCLTGPIPATTNGRLVPGSSAAGGARPRLLIAALPSSLALVRRKAALEDVGGRAELSPSPPSSDGSADAACFGPLRNRSKMHELAIKQRLITEQDPRGNGCVSLSAEERRTLVQEGYAIPCKLPLSKQEEESLKIVRRKIKNKLSAQESRRKRKEYMETLEQRVQNYHSENASLRQRLRQLEASNRSLGGQLKKTIAATSAASSAGSSAGSSSPPQPISIATQTSVCLTALVLLFAVCMPTLPGDLLPTSFAPFLSTAAPVAAAPSLPDLFRPASVTRPSRTLGSAEEQSCGLKPLFQRHSQPPTPEAGGFAQPVRTAFSFSLGVHEDGSKDDVREAQADLWLAESPPTPEPLEDRQRNLSGLHCRDCGLDGPPATMVPAPTQA